MKLSLFLIGLLIIFSACNSQQNGSGEIVPPQKTVPKLKEILVYPDGSPNLFYSLAMQKATQLQLDSLESGVDSLEIRIWFDYSRTDTCDMLRIYRQNDEWKSTFYQLTVEWNDTKLTEQIISKNADTTEPLTGWDFVMRKLDSLGLYTLPDISKIPNADIPGADRPTINIEFANSKQYRFFSYTCPYRIRGSIAEAERLAQILDILLKEFSITLKQKC